MNMRRIAAAASAAAIFTSALPVDSQAISVKAPVNGCGVHGISFGGASYAMPKFRAGGSQDSGGLIQTAANGAYRGVSESRFPAKYRLSDLYTTPVKDQTGYGTCWAHSAIASAESSLAPRRPDIDLSEFHTAYYTYSGGDQMTLPEVSPDTLLSAGGNSMFVGNLWSQWIGPVLEKRLPYGETGFFSDDERTSQMKYQSDCHMRDGFLFDIDSENSNRAEVGELVKEFIYSGHAVDAAFCANSAGSYNGTYFSTNSRRKPQFANHSAAIVGWDDSFPANHFSHPADSDGAWLVKNSWGSKFGDEGYMWISYEDRSLCEFAVFEMDDNCRYTELFAHDSYPPLQSMSAADEPEIDSPTYAANVFTAGETAQIEAVSAYISQPDTTCEITVYTGLTDKSDPRSGKPSAKTTALCGLTGFRTIELDEDVVVEKGEDFAVVVRMQCPDSPFVTSIESCVVITDEETGEVISLGTGADYYSLKAHTGAQESLYSADGEHWLDMADGDYRMTDEEKADLFAQLEEELYDGIEPDETELLEDASEKVAMYREIFARGPATLIVGNISLKALGNPVNSVDLSAPSGRLLKSEKVSVSVKDGRDVMISVNGGDYVKYTEPVEITELTEISATVDFEHFETRTYIQSDWVWRKGDADASGAVDAADASLVLNHYSALQTGKKPPISPILEDCADMNGDGVLDAGDASAILELYAKMSTKSGKQTDQNGAPAFV